MQEDHILTGYDEPYNSETCDSVMMNNLFSKYGFADGDDPRADGIHAAFSEHLRKSGYENQILGSVHNRRVSFIEVERVWYTTELLPWGEDWTLLTAVEGIMNGDETKPIAVPDDLKQCILDFLPTAYDMMHPRNLTKEKQ